MTGGSSVLSHNEQVVVPNQIIQYQAACALTESSRSSGSSSPELSHVASINTLPDEILIEIFMLTAPDEVPTRMLEFLPLTWVCRRWRAVVLNAASFWTKIDLGCVNYELAKTVLSRSKKARLDIDPINDESLEFSDINVGIRILENLIGPHFGRLNSLSLKFSTFRWRQLQHVLEQEAPSLKYLSLASAPKESSVLSVGSPWLSNAYSKLVRLPILFNGVACLETLVFNMPQSPPWTALIPLMGNLRTLKVVSAPWDLATGVSTHDELLQALQTCLKLEYLELETLQQMQEQMITLEPINNSVAPLELPHLSQIILRSSKDANLLRHLIVPRLTQLYLTLDEEVSNGLVTTITDRFRMGLIREMIIGTGCAFLGTSRQLTRSDWSYLMKKTFVPDMHVLSIDCCCREVKADILFPPFIKRAENATRLVIRGGPQSQPYSASWRPLEISQGALIRETKISHLVLALREDVRPILRLLEENSICPKLETLTCIGGFGKELYVGAQIRECVRHRNSENGSSIKKINMVHCPTMDKYCVKEIRSFHVKVSEDLTEDEYSPSGSSALVDFLGVQYGVYGW